MQVPSSKAMDQLFNVTECSLVGHDGGYALHMLMTTISYGHVPIFSQRGTQSPSTVGAISDIINAVFFCEADQVIITMRTI